MTSMHAYKYTQLASSTTYWMQFCVENGDFEVILAAVWKYSAFDN